MTPANRIEITLSDEKLAELDAARGREPRASFIKYALDEALTPPGRADDSDYSPPLGERRMTPEVDAILDKYRPSGLGKGPTPPRPKGKR